MAAANTKHTNMQKNKKKGKNIHATYKRKKEKKKRNTTNYKLKA